jgi:hypothetical protein
VQKRPTASERPPARVSIASAMLDRAERISIALIFTCAVSWGAIVDMLMDATCSTACIDVAPGCLRAKEGGCGAAAFGSRKEWPAIEDIVESSRFTARNGDEPQSHRRGYRRRV